MNRVRFIGLQLPALVLVIAGALTLAGQAKPSNLFKEIQDRKAKITWSNAPATFFPADVCNILGCVPSADKYIANKATEGGKQIGRALVLSHDAKKGDLIIMRRDTPTDYYYFSVGPDGSVQKAAYLSPGKPWVPMGVAVSKPISDKEKEFWLERLEKIGNANSAQPAAAPQG